MMSFGEFKLAERSLNLDEVPSTSGYFSAQNLGAITGVAGAISSMFASQTQAIGYEMQAAVRKAQASQAVSMAKMNNLKLHQQYNDVAANQTVLTAIQGRSGGSVANIARVDKERLAWDKEYMKLSGEYQSAGVLADAIGFESTSKMAMTAGTSKGLLQVAGTVQDYARIK